MLLLDLALKTSLNKKRTKRGNCSKFNGWLWLANINSCCWQFDKPLQDEIIGIPTEGFVENIFLFLIFLGKFLMCVTIIKNFLIANNKTVSDRVRREGGVEEIIETIKCKL